MDCVVADYELDSSKNGASAVNLARLANSQLQ